MGILDGIRVIDLTRLISGPITTRILADFGAEVIKIQSKRTAYGMEDPKNPFYYYLNRNKRGITLNLDKPEAKELLLQLSQISDIVVENFSPRVMENFGLSYDIFKLVNPRIIMISISSMGRNGPWRNFICFSHTFHALSGLTYLLSSSLNTPVQVGFSYADIVIGLYGAIAVIAALIKREIRGEGEFIDLSGLEAIISLLGEAFLKDTSFHSKRLKNNYPFSLSFKCKGKNNFCVISIGREEDRKKLIEILGIPETSTWEEIKKALAELAKNYTARDFVRYIEKRGVSASMVRSAKDILEDKRLKEKAFFIKLENRIMMNSPLRSLEDSSKRWSKAPGLGEDNKYVFCELLGLKEEKLETYIKEGIIF